MKQKYNHWIDNKLTRLYRHEIIAMYLAADMPLRLLSYQHPSNRRVKRAQNKVIQGHSLSGKIERKVARLM